MKIDVQNIINNPFHTDLRRLKANSDDEMKELIALRSAAMEQVSRFFSSRPGFSKMATGADKKLFAKPSRYNCITLWLSFGMFDIIGNRPFLCFPKLSAINCWYHLNKFSESVS